MKKRWRGEVKHLSMVSYSKLVWSGVKDLFNIFLCYLNILFISVYKENDSGTEEVLQWFKNGDSRMYLGAHLQYLVLVPIGKRVRNGGYVGLERFFMASI